MKSFQEIINNTTETLDEGVKTHASSIATLERALGDMGFKKSGRVLTAKNVDRGKMNMVNDYVSAIGKLGGPKRKVKYYDETKTMDITE